jgi:hypothetical protein
MLIRLFRSRQTFSIPNSSRTNRHISCPPRLLDCQYRDMPWSVQVPRQREIGESEIEKKSQENTMHGSVACISYGQLSTPTSFEPLPDPLFLTQRSSTPQKVSVELLPFGYFARLSITTPYIEIQCYHGIETADVCFTFTDLRMIFCKEESYSHDIIILRMVTWYPIDVNLEYMLFVSVAQNRMSISVSGYSTQLIRRSEATRPFYILILKLGEYLNGRCRPQHTT